MEIGILCMMVVPLLIGAVTLKPALVAEVRPALVADSM